MTHRVSSFIGIGKATILKKLMTFPDSLSLGDPSASLDDVIDSSVIFVDTLYGKEHGASFNSMRADIFKRKIAGKRHVPPKLSSLPPTNGCLQTPLPTCPFPNSIVEGCRHAFAPRFGPIAVWVGDEWIRTAASSIPARAVSCTR